jgi:hypothetical protein
MGISNRRGWAICLALVCAVFATLYADVKMDEKSLVKFGGMMGKVMGLFGGKAAKEGLVSTVAVKGDRKSTRSDVSGEIIDLAEEKIYQLDMNRKSYKVVTFAQMRRQLEEARQRAEKQAARDESKQKQEFEIDFDAKESGQRRTINGYECREVVMTITVRQKGKTLEQAGGMVMKSNLWLTPEVAAAKEVADFDRRYWEKLYGGLGLGGADEQMMTAMALFPGLKEAMEKMGTENVNLHGTQILTLMTVDSVPSKEQAAQQQKRKEESESSGGLLGGLRGRFGRKKDDSQPSGAAKPDSVMTSTHEILKIDTVVSAEDVSVPVGFKLKE